MKHFKLLLLLLAIANPQPSYSQSEAGDMLENLVGSIIEQSENLSLTRQDYLRIKRKGNTFYVPEDLRSKALFSLPQISKQALVSQISKDHKVIGIRVEKILKPSIIDTLGVEIGDILQTINGNKITSEASTLELVSRLQSQDSFVLGLLRGVNGQPVKLYYKLIN